MPAGRVLNSVAECGRAPPSGIVSSIFASKARYEFSSNSFKGVGGPSGRVFTDRRAQARRRNSNEQRSGLDRSNEANADARPGPRYFQPVAGSLRCASLADHGGRPDAPWRDREPGRDAACRGANKRPRETAGVLEFRTAADAHRAPATALEDPYKATSAIDRCKMKISRRWAEAVRCRVCALAGIASMSSDEDSDTIHRLPEGFKVVKTEQRYVIYCAVCNQAADRLPIDS